MWGAELRQNGLSVAHQVGGLAQCVRLPLDDESMVKQVESRGLVASAMHFAVR